MKNKWPKTAKTICFLMERNGWSKPELAEILGVEKPFIYSLASGQRSLPPQLVKKMAKTPVDVDTLITAYGIDSVSRYESKLGKRKSK